MSIVLDHPTHAKTAAPNPLLLLPVVLMLRELLERTGEITIKQTDLTDLRFWGLTEFATRTVHLADDLDDDHFRWTVIHEILHNLYGPAGTRCSDVEEARIEASTAAVLLDAAATLALQVRAERIGEDVAKVDTPRARRRLVSGIEQL